MPQAKIKERLREAMERKGLRAVDLVEKTGIPKNTMSYYLSGRTEPKADRLYELALALDVNEAWLLGYDVDHKRSEEQKKNDQLAGLIGRLRSDESFFAAVAALANLGPVEFQTVEQLLGVLVKNSPDQI